MDNFIKTLVLGGSLNSFRYSYKAITSLRERGFPVVSIGRKEGLVSDVHIVSALATYEDIHTVSIYLSEENQKKYEEYILSLKPKRIIFNPGAENMKLYQMAESMGVEVMNACTLVLLSLNQY